MNQQAIVCPKCNGAMYTHNRNGVHIEQCGQCRGIFLDFGELEALTNLHLQWMQQQQMTQPPPQSMGGQPPGWGASQPGYHQGGYYKPHKKGFMGLLFSS